MMVPLGGLLRLGRLMTKALWMLKFFRYLKREETGATAIEYALIAGLIFLVIVSAVNLLSSDLENTFNDISNNV